MKKYVYSEAKQVVVCGDFARAGRSHNLVGWGGKASGISSWIPTKPVKSRYKYRIISKSCKGHDFTNIDIVLYQVLF